MKVKIILERFSNKVKIGQCFHTKRRYDSIRKRKKKLPISCFDENLNQTRNIFKSMQRYHQILKDCEQIMRLIIPLVKYIIFNILELEFEYPLVENLCQRIGKSVFWLS